MEAETVNGQGVTREDQKSAPSKRTFSPFRAVNRLLSLPVLLFIRFYQFAVRPILPMCCRFSPSGSDYSRQALDKYGFFKGIYLTIRRICRCHPFNPGGYDPVP